MLYFWFLMELFFCPCNQEIPRPWRSVQKSEWLQEEGESS
uniref:Uncharacterized protein n=1 Tax=Arundo donax TaxID=35708 RepID=A0A0A9F3Y2_ARUDO